MKKSVLIVAALGVLALTGCVSIPPPDKPRVSVVSDNFIVVSPEPLVFEAGGEPVDIEWRLPALSRFTFPKNGVTVDYFQAKKNAPSVSVTKDQFDCELKENTGGKTFRCRNFKKQGIYRYTIRVNDGSRELPPLDPYMMNN